MYLVLGITSNIPSKANVSEGATSIWEQENDIDNSEYILHLVM